MKRSPEEEMDLALDALNTEQIPPAAADPELLAAARVVRQLRPAAAPAPGFAPRLSKRRARWSVPAVAAAAVLLLFTLVLGSGILPRGPVYAMERAVARLENYHGVLTMYTQNATGEAWMVRQQEIWAEGDKYAVRQDSGTLTVNNGTAKWQTDPAGRAVVLLPVVPDPSRHAFDLKAEAARASQYPHTVEATETVAGRAATKLTITPPGGLPYELWLDEATGLPLQLRTAMAKSLQTTYTYTSFTANTAIDPGVFAYSVPAGYRVVADGAGQIATTLPEAAAISGLAPLCPAAAPERLLALPGQVVLDYGDTTITEVRAAGSLVPAAPGALGTAAGGPLEIRSDSLRWQQDGLEIQISGPQRLALARQIAPDLTLPDPAADLTAGMRVAVPVDLEVVRNNQQQVDAGSSPWQLDPLQVAATFANLQVNPDGISGEPALPYETFALTANNGTTAVVAATSGPLARIYLQRLARTDETGIWAVVGYDPR